MKISFIAIAILIMTLALPSAMASATFTKISDPTTLPTGDGQAVSWSPSGEYVSVAHGTTPYVTIYSVSGTTFTKLPNPTGGLPTCAGLGTSWNDDSSILTVVDCASPYIFNYQRTGTGVSATFAKLSDPSTLPTGQGNGAAWSHDGSHLAIAHGTSPFLTVYSVSGTTFTKLSNPATLPTGNGIGLGWNHDATMLAIGHFNSPFVSIYSLSGSTLTKIANPASLPTGVGRGIDWNSDGSYLAVGHDTSPFTTVYSVSGSTFTKLSDPSSLPANSGNGVSWSPNDAYLTIAHPTSPFLSNYEISGSGASASLTKHSDPAVLPTGTGTGASWNSDGSLLSISHVSSPRLTTYSVSPAQGPSLTPDPPILGGSIVYNVATFSWAEPSGAPLGYNLTSVNPQGAVSTIALGPTPLSYVATLNKAGMWQFNLTAWNGAGDSSPSNNVFLNATFRPLFGDDGVVWGSEGRTDFAQEVGMTYDSIGAFYGLFVMVATAVIGYAVGQLVNRSWIGAIVGTIAGIAFATIMGFFNAWTVALIGVGGIAIFTIIKVRSKGE